MHHGIWIYSDKGGKAVSGVAWGKVIGVMVWVWGKAV